MSLRVVGVTVDSVGRQPQIYGESFPTAASLVKSEVQRVAVDVIFKSVPKPVIIVQKLAGIVRFSGEVLSRLYNPDAPIMQTLRKLKVVAFLTFASVFYYFLVDGYKLGKALFWEGRKVTELKQDILKFTERLSNAIGTTESMLSAAMTLKWIAETPFLKVLTPGLLGFSTILSVASMILNGQQLKKGKDFTREFYNKKNAEGITNAVHALAEEDSAILVERFDVSDGDKFKLRLKAIQKRLETSDDRAVKEKTFRALEGRLLTKNLSHALKILAGIIVCIAVPILIFCPPLSIAAFALFGCSTAIGLGGMIMDIVANKILSKELKELAMEEDDGEFDRWISSDSDFSIKEYKLSAERKTLINYIKDKKEAEWHFDVGVIWETFFSILGFASA